MSKELTYAVVGATGAVGKETISVLEERDVEVHELRLLASARSAGELLTYKGRDILVEELTPESFKGVDIALFCAGSGVSVKFAPHAIEAGTIIIDKTSAFRMDKDVALAVPEVNSHAIIEALKNKPAGKGLIISNPNCSTIPLTVVLKPIIDAVGVERVVASTYQSVSGAGKEGIDELWEQTRAIYTQGEDVPPSTFQHQIAFNCIPHIDSFLDNGYTKEEVKLIEESKKILEQPDLKLTATAVRVPVFSCHSESVNIQTKKPLSADACRELLKASPGIIVEDNPSDNLYPHGVKIAGTDATYVGRIREDETLENGLNMWIVADNLRKGAALNGVQVAEIVAQHI